MKRTTSVRTGLLVVAACAALFAAYGALEVLVRGRDLEPGLKFVASFACFGLLFGGIVAFDTLPNERGPNRPLLRVVLGALAGLLLSVVWRWPGEGIGLSLFVGAALGYAGVTWAKYV